MILNVSKTISLISSFLSDYIKKSNRKSFILNYKHHAVDYVTARICEEARLTCGAQIYLFTNEQPVGFKFAKQVSYGQYLPESFFDSDDSVIVSSICRTSGIVERCYHKHLDPADLYPVLDLYYSEMLTLYKALNDYGDVIDLSVDCEYKNHEILEFCDRENIKNNIINSKDLPHKNKQWFKYTKQQKDAIAKLHQTEKLTKHKDLISRGAIYPSIRDGKIVR